MERSDRTDLRCIVDEYVKTAVVALDLCNRRFDCFAISNVD